MLLIDFAIFLIAATAWAVFCPDTDIGRMLRRALIDGPAQWFGKASPLKVALSLIVGAALVMLMVSSPELMPIIAADFMLYVDLTVALTVTGASMRWRWIRHVVVRLGRAATAVFRPQRTGVRRLRATRTVRRDGGRKGEDPDPGWLAACFSAVENRGLRRNFCPNLAYYRVS